MKKKIKRKTEICLNCHKPLDLSDNYCSNCGQLNDDGKVSFGTLVGDFISNYFSIDSRFGRTIKPFFIKPGFLTREFMKGKRKTYADPVRLYLVISLIYFFVIGHDFKLEPELEDRDSVIELNNPAFDSLSKSDQNEFEFNLWPLSSEEWVLLNNMANDDQYSLANISDTLKLEDRPFLERRVVLQAAKIARSDTDNVKDYVLENIPILMFLLLPVFAVILKILIWKKYYISHLIHSLHLHSFAFLVLTVVHLYEVITGSSAYVSALLMFVALPVYIIFSFKNAYEFTFGRAFFKSFFSITLYSFVLLIAILLELIFSLLTY